LKPKLLRTKHVAAIGKQILMNSIWEYAYAKVFVVLAEGLDMFRLRANATGGRIIPPGNSTFTKRTSVECMPGS
jgi:hypothetical protein